MNLSLDGFMSGPKGELDWHFESWNEEMGEKLLDLLERADTILLGRITFEAMAEYWSFRPLEQHFPRQDLAIADKMNSLRKIVFSENGTTVRWRNTRISGLPLEDEIRQIRGLDGKNILLFGSGKLVSACIGSGLVDEYQLWIHPVILGLGTPMFSNLGTVMNFQLSGTEIFKSGVILLIYQPSGNKKVAPFRRQQVAAG